METLRTDLMATRRTADAVEEMLRLQKKKKITYSVDINGTTSRIDTTFQQQLTFDPDKNYEMALINLNTYYSFPNVDATNNKFRYTANNGLDWKLIEIPLGSYELEDINNYIQRVMKANGDWDETNNAYYITILADINTLRSILNITSNTYQVDFTIPETIRTLLGFDSGIYFQGYNSSQNIVDILPITQLYVYNDLIQFSTINGVQSNSIYSFFPDVGPGYKIIQEPANILYYPIFTGNNIYKMTTSLVDQNGKLVDLRGETLTINFNIREVQ